MILERRFIAAKWCPGLERDDLAGSLYEAWERKFGLDVARADQTIRAVPICEKDARLLQVENGAAGLLVISVGCLRSGEPLWWERLLYRGDAYEFRNRLDTERTARPAEGAFRNPGT